jgi:hypothetical protein
MSAALVVRGIGYLFKCMLVFLFPFYVSWQIFSSAGKWKELSLGTRLFIVFFLVFSLQIILSGGDFMAYARFYLPLLPIAAMVPVDLYLFRKSPEAKPGQPVSAKHWAYLAAAIFAINFVNPFILLNHVKHRVAIGLTQAWVEQGKVLFDHTPADAELATAGIGAIGYFSKRPLIDIVGLTDEEIAHNEVPNKGRGWPGHESHNTEYLLSRKPDILLVCNLMTDQPWKRCFCEFSDRFRIPAVKNLFAHPNFNRDYVFANLDLSGRYLSGYLLRENLGKPGYENWAPSEDASSTCENRQQLLEEFKKRMPMGRPFP